jgi:hypothetical protein
MKRGGGSRKGSAFERSICKLLSEWWTNGKEDDIFWRTHGSGARATTRHKKGQSLKSQVGDIAAVDKRGRRFCQCFTVSIKRGYKGVTIQDLIDVLDHGKEPMLLGWIKECYEQTLQADSIGWLLIVKRNQRKALVFFPDVIRWGLEKYKKNQFEFLWPRAEIRTFFKKKTISSFHVLTLDQFLEIFDRKTIISMVLNS